MNEDTPPSAQTPSPPELVNMRPRWLWWLIASVVMPALPWLAASPTSNSDAAFSSIIVLTTLALLLQLATSIAVAIGFCKRRNIGLGGAIGMTVVFMLASVAIGTAIWFAVCVARISTDFK